MTATAADDAAWTALLPGGTVWLSGPPGEAAAATGFARAVAPWSLRSRPGGHGVRAYIAVPARRRPLIVASWDRAVLRYLADAVLSVPPGAGQLLSMAATAGLRMFRYPGAWRCAAMLRAAGAVLVGRTE